MAALTGAADVKRFSHFVRSLIDHNTTDMISYITLLFLFLLARGLDGQNYTNIVASEAASSWINGAASSTWFSGCNTWRVIPSIAPAISPTDPVRDMVWGTPLVFSVYPLNPDSNYSLSLFFLDDMIAPAFRTQALTINGAAAVPASVNLLPRAKSNITLFVSGSSLAPVMGGALGLTVSLSVIPTGNAVLSSFSLASSNSADARVVPPLVVSLAQVPATAAPLVNVSWTGGGAFSGALITTTSAPYLVWDDFVGPPYAVGGAWTTPGLKPGGWTVEEASLQSPALWFAFSSASFLTIGNSDTGTCTDQWVGTRAPALGSGACLPPPLVYQDVPLQGSWQAELRLRTPVVSATPGTMQCGFILFDRQSSAAAPFSAANANVNNMLISFTVQVITAATAQPVFESPGGPGGAAAFKFAPAAVRYPYWSLVLQFDHVANAYSAFYRGTATGPLLHIATVGASNIPAALPNMRLGVYAKSWTTGRQWSCAVDLVTIQAMPNAPFAPAWISGVPASAGAGRGSAPAAGAAGVALWLSP